MQFYFCGMCRFLVPVRQFNRKGEVQAGLHEPLNNLGRPRICIDVKLTLLNSAHNVGFELWMFFKHGSEVLAGEFSRSLAAVAIKNCETAIVAGSFEVLLRHELLCKQKRDKKLLTSYCGGRGQSWMALTKSERRGQMKRRAVAPISNSWAVAVNRR